ncbi:MAG: hypothetical protein ACI9O6_003193 [Glaciecola sp.]|jgi:hypothetical protein
MYNHIEVIQMNASNFLSANVSLNNSYSMSSNTRAACVANAAFIGNAPLDKLETGIKSIDHLVQRYSINFNIDEGQLADNAFQKSLVLYGQDQRLDYFNLPPCMYMIIAAASAEEKFIVHRFYLPYKNGVRFATYLLNEEGEIVESVSYQRNVKYLQAFKIIRKQIALANQINESIAA